MIKSKILIKTQIAYKYSLEFWLNKYQYVSIDSSNCDKLCLIKSGIIDRFQISEVIFVVVVVVVQEDVTFGSLVVYTHTWDIHIYLLKPVKSQKI